MTTADDFRRIALSVEDAEERAHMGAADFRVGGRIFAALQAEGYGNLVLSPACSTNSWTRPLTCLRPLPVAGDGWT